MHISKSNNILHLGYVVYFLLRENKHFLYQIPRRFYISILFPVKQERGDTRSLRSRSLSGARARLLSRKQGARTCSIPFILALVMKISGARACRPIVLFVYVSSILFRFGIKNPRGSIHPEWTAGILHQNQQYSWNFTRKTR